MRVPSDNQSIETPQSFFEAVEEYFNISFKYDMAASEENAKCLRYYTKEQDALNSTWPDGGWCWLNPPFNNLTSWVKKCYQQSKEGNNQAQIISIWPLSSDINQLLAWQQASIYIIHGRVWPNVRSCMLCKWDRFSKPTIEGLIWYKKDKTLTRWW
jgi:phage N-6-adenine-methyltransferase